MKLEYLKKALIRTAIISFASFAVIGVITYFIMSYDDSLIEQIAKIKSDTTGNEGQYTVAVKQVKDAKDALEFYSDYSSSESSDPENFRREYAKNLLGKLKDELGLVDLKFSMDQFKNRTGSYSKKHVTFATSKVTVQLAANSDADIYAFIKDIGQSFPGSIAVISYKITRKVDLTDEVMKKLTDDVLSKGIVDGEVEFEWGTILDNPEVEKSGDNPAAGAGARIRHPGPGQVTP